VWTGQQAKGVGLVDALGGLDRAVALAKERAKIAADQDVEVVVYPPAKSFYELLTDEMSGGAEAAVVDAWMSSRLSSAEIEMIRTLRGPAALFKPGEPLALMPFRLVR
jgi:protease-4